MKRIFAFIVTVLIFLSVPVFSSTEGKPVETPDTKFVVNGRSIELSDVPLNLNGRTLLPLRASLVSLGVPNDEEHIKWNGKDGSVTVLKNSISIYLKLGSSTALVDGKPVALDAPPLQYSKNQRVYIPVRFISNAAGKEVVWDGATRTVFIRDRDKYAEMKAVIEEIADSMDGVGRVRLSSETRLDVSKKGSKTLLKISMDEELDKKAGVMSSKAGISLFGTEIALLSFYKDNSEFSRISDGQWMRTPMEEDEFKAVLTEDVSLSTLNSIEVMAASLERQPGSEKGLYILKGSLYPAGIASDMCRKTGIGSMHPESCTFEAVIDEKTNLVRSVHAEFSGKVVSGSSVSSAAAVIDVEYSDFDGVFEIRTPEGLKL